eukprot:254484-Chlamydomonas_euryale.AAC.2
MEATPSVTSPRLYPTQTPSHPPPGLRAQASGIKSFYDEGWKVFNSLNSIELKSLEEPRYLMSQFARNPIACLTLATFLTANTGGAGQGGAGRAGAGWGGVGWGGNGWGGVGAGAGLGGLCGEGEEAFGMHAGKALLNLSTLNPVLPASLIPKAYTPEPYKCASTPAPPTRVSLVLTLPRLPLSLGCRSPALAYTGTSGYGGCPRARPIPSNIASSAHATRTHTSDAVASAHATRTHTSNTSALR